MTDPLIRLTNVWREYATGDHVVSALKNVNVTIDTGEFVAIIGPSGSGKSTMMNILGCLDKPTKGTYMVAGRDVADLSPDELAQLRREHFGFIFQRYHLLADLNAQGNVEVPAVYAGWSRGKRHERAKALLTRLGLDSRLHHHPNQLSGGQQQRVSVARALMNGGEVILADEPTGALDSRSGEEMLRILEELSAEGHTVIVVTHDSKVAAHANRIITISDGEIVSDVPTEKAGGMEKVKRQHKTVSVKSSWAAGIDRLGEALRMAVAAMAAHKLRTFLTMLGIIIGIASVVTIVALGDGSKEAILSEISTMGSNTVTLYPGKGAGDPNATNIHTLNLADVSALSAQVYADSVTPAVTTTGLMRAGNADPAPGVVNGVGEQSFRVRGVKLAEGRVFTAEDVANYSQVLVIDDATRHKMFPSPAIDPIGKVIIIAGVPFEVIGVTAKTANLFFSAGDTLNVWAPYTTVNARLLHAEDLHSITVRITNVVPTEVAMGAMTKLVSLRHAVSEPDFYMVSADSVR
ncbi:MAG: ABC transporter permease, partial [Alphaproteobacteria bacterium]